MQRQEQVTNDGHVIDDVSQRATFEEIFERAPVGCGLILDDGTILRANRTMVSLLEVAQRPLEGTSLLEYLDGDDRIPVMQFLASVTPENGDAPLEVHVRARAGASRVCLLSAARGANEPCIRIALMDATGRRAAERTALQAQKMEAIGRMAGGIAHDLNNLLTVVSVHDDILLTAVPEDDPKREDLVAIQRALQQAAALTAKLLSFARPQLLDRRRVFIKTSVEDFARVLRRRLSDGVELTTIGATPGAEAEIDPSQLEQVLQHLVRNAEEAMLGGGRVVIETKSVELGPLQLAGHPGVKPGWFAVIRVSDTGMGMDPPTLSHAFEPYFTTKPRGENHGLGLATVYAIARQNGGFVTATSRAGDGTVIEFYLPALEPVEPPSVSAPTPNDGVASGTILIVEDEPAIRSVIERMLAKQGYVCHVASDGEEALRQLGSLNGEVDLVLSDIVMPNCNGPELVRRLRVAHPTLPVVFMTGYASIEELTDATMPHFSGVLRKPFTLGALQKIVRQALNEAQPSGGEK